MEEKKLKYEMIWKIWKKSKLNSEKIWKLWKKSKLNSEKIGENEMFYNVMYQKNN